MPAMRFLSIFAILAAGCGAKTHLDIGTDPADGGSSIRRDGAVIADGGGPIDDGSTLTDRPPDAIVPSPCESSGAYVLFAGESILSLPALARVSETAALLVYTEEGPRGTSMVWALPLLPDGELLGEPQRVGPGQGGTIVPVAEANAYVIVHSGPDLALHAAIADDRGRVMERNPIDIDTDTLRPGFAVSGDAFALAWSAAGASLAIVGPDGSEPSLVMLPGTDPWLAPVRSRMGWFRASTLGSNAVSTHTFDIGGRVEPTEDHRVEGRPVAARVVDGVDDDALVTLTQVTGPPGPRSRTVVNMHTGAFDQNFSTIAATPIDLGAAYDEDTGWMLAAVGLIEDPRVHLYGMRRGTRADQQIWSGPDPRSLPPRPAVMATGAPGEFLVVWEHSVEAVIMAANISCR